MVNDGGGQPEHPPLNGLESVLAAGVPAATVVHTLWSFVPSLEGSFAPAGYLDVLARFRRHLVVGVRDLDGGDVPANVRHVGPVLEPEGPDAGWLPPARSLVVVSMGTTDMGEAPVLQRVLDALAGLQGAEHRHVPAAVPGAAGDAH